MDLFQTILFTMDDEILEAVSHFDQAFEADIVMDDVDEEEDERPRTADEGEVNVPSSLV